MPLPKKLAALWAAATVSAINPNVRLQETAEPTEYLNERRTGSRSFPKTMGVVCKAAKDLLRYVPLHSFDQRL
jgi:hypothetical protein